MCIEIKVKTQQQQNQMSKHKNICQSRESKPGSLKVQSDALPLGH